MRAIRFIGVFGLMAALYAASSVAAHAETQAEFYCRTRPAMCAPGGPGPGGA